MVNVRTSDALLEEYREYYSDGSVDAKREIMGDQALRHVTALVGSSRFKRVLDVGCGEGSFLQRASASGLADEYYGIEISASGIEETLSKNIPNLVEVKAFDGYQIPYPDKFFDFGVVAHVIEHVEHERLFVSEVARVCQKFYIETPLEDTVAIERAIRVSGKYGHINFYNEKRLINLLRTTDGVNSVESHRVFSHDRAYEVHLSGTLKGTLKSWVRSYLLKFFPNLAMRRLVYIIGVVCVSA